MDNVITEGRAAIAVEVGERLQTYLNRYGTGILVSKANIDQSVPPKQVQDAFDDVQRAKEDEPRVVNEATAYRESVVPEARGDAQKEILQAEAYRDQVTARAEGEAQRFNKLLAEYRNAKQVTRDRLYIDAMETVLSHSTKILVDVKGANNMLYLPLDRLMQQMNATPRACAPIRPRIRNRRCAQRPRCDAANQPLTEPNNAKSGIRSSSSCACCCSRSTACTRSNRPNGRYCCDSARSNARTCSPVCISNGRSRTASRSPMRAC